KPSAIAEDQSHVTVWSITGLRVNRTDGPAALVPVVPVVQAVVISRRQPAGLMTG
ncbi:hypothetical protein BaRGS_00006795, partial [Batillaria attramentaria]